MRWIVSLVPPLAALLPLPLVAASFCVSNSAELQAALAAAASNADSNDTIRMRPGGLPDAAIRWRDLPMNQLLVRIGRIRI